MSRLLGASLITLLAAPAVLAAGALVFILISPAGFTALATVVTDQPQLITNTLAYGVLSGLLATGFGWLLAHLRYSYAVPGGGLLHLAASAGILMPSITFAMAVVMLFGNSGLLVSTLGWGGSYGFWGLVVASTFARLPVAYLAMSWAYRALDVRMLEAAEGLGASGLRVLRSVLLPRLGATLVATVCVMTADTVADLAVPLVLGGDFGTLAGALYEAVSGEGDLAKAVAYAICLAPMGLILRPLARWFYARPLTDASRANQRRLRPMSPRGWLLATLGWLVVGFSALLLAAVGYGSVVWAVGVDGRPTMSHFVQIISGSNTRALATTIMISLLAVPLVLGLAGGLTRAAVSSPLRQAGRLLVLLGAIPGVVLGLGVHLLAEWWTSRWPLTSATIQLAPWVALVAILTVHMLRFIPAAASPMLATAELASASIHDTALSLGVPSAVVARARLTPLLRPQFIDGGLTIFARTLTAISSVILLTNAQLPLLSVRMLVSIDAGRLSSAAAMNVVLAGLVAAAALTARLLGASSGRENR